MEKIIAWVALLTIFIIPAASIVLRMWKKKMKSKSQVRIQENRDTFQTDKDSHPKKNSQIESSSPSSEFFKKEILVLGVLIRGSKTFGDIQKNTGMYSSELDQILENLEKNAMLQVQQKKGLLGIKIELHPTEKGFKAYSSY